MSPERWQRIKSVYGEALEREGADREAFLAEACYEDLELRAEVDSLLRAKDASGLESPLQAPDWSGRDLGPFHLIEKIGEGGMGSVWKAQDAKLGRAVALKFVAAHSLSDEAQQRLLREAQASAALDHPNICHVYGIHEEQGQTFIAMAYIDGPSLADKIRERPLPLGEALDIAIQIAEGLQEAHEKGIVHRDIKPANVMLTAKGQVKIMDFGLASLADRSKLTKTGTTLGTPAYMAPEQLEGLEVDRRTDLWALACVLYEMLTQHSPFEAEYEQAVAYGILNENPEPVSAQRSGLPLDVDRVIGKGLAKDKVSRYQHADDFLVDLKELRMPRAQTALPKSAPVPVAATPSWKSLVPVAVAAVAITGAVVGWFAGKFGGGPASPSYHLELNPPPGIAYTAFALSPDGTRVAFIGEGVGSPKLWVQSLVDHSARAIEGSENADPVGTPFWSPDGEQIGFFADGKLKRVTVEQGGVQTLCDAPFGRGGTWNESGEIVYTPRANTGGLWRTNLDSGECLPLYERSWGEGGLRNPEFLPDGQSLLATERSRGGARLVLGSLAAPDTMVIAQGIAHGVFAESMSSRDNYLLYEREGSIWASPVETGGTRLSGDATLITTGAGFSRISGRGLLDAAGGVLGYLPAGADSQQRQIGWFDRSGKPVGVIANAQTLAFRVELSPDEQWLLYTQIESFGRSLPKPIRLDLATGISTAVDVPGLVIGPRGERTFFASGDGIGAAPFRGGPEQFVFRASESVGSWPSEGPWAICTMSADESTFVFQAFSEETGWDLWTASISDGDSQPLYDKSYDEGHAQLSPDGRWIAYVTNQSGSFEVYADAFPPRGGLVRISVDGGWLPRWRSDGSEVFYVDKTGVLMAVPVDWTGGSPRFGRAQPLFPVSSAYINVTNLNMLPMYTYDVSQDGQRFVALWRPPDMPFPPLQVITNWETRLK